MGVRRREPVLGRTPALDLPQHPRQHRPKRLILLAVDQELGEPCGSADNSRIRRSARPLEVGQREDVEQLGAGSRPERIQALPQAAVDFARAHSARAKLARRPGERPGSSALSDIPAEVQASGTNRMRDSSASHDAPEASLGGPSAGRPDPVRSMYFFAEPIGGGSPSPSPSSDPGSARLDVYEALIRHLVNPKGTTSDLRAH
jgi:hypothetical protein